MRLLKETNINFLGNRKFAYIFSLSLIILGFIFLIIRGGFNPSIDFAGGIILELHFEPAVHVDEIRATLNEMGIKNAIIQNIGTSGNDILIKVKSGTDVNISEKIKEKLKEKFSANIPPTVDGVNKWVLGEEKVDAKMGKEFIWKAFLSILFACIAIVIYIWIRFEFYFGLGAVIALIHDTLITLGFLVIFDKEISITIIAAILTIIGFSLNDTIVIFDRIREGIKKYANASTQLEQLMNKSINETLSRTILTSLTVLFVILCLLIFGPSILKDFAFAMLIGVTIGTYSSVFVASAMLAEFHNRGIQVVHLRK